MASLLGRTIAPALHGAGQGLDRVIALFDRGADFFTFFFAILALVTASLKLVHTAREPRLGLFYRMVALALGAVVVTLIMPSMPLRLPDRGVWITGVASALLALIAAWQGLRVPQTRALGLILACVGSSALFHLAAIDLSISALPRTLFLSRSFASAAISLDGLSLFIALFWLASRTKERVSWPLVFAMAGAYGFFLGASEGRLDDANLWQIIAHRSLDQLALRPASYVEPFMQHIFEASALALAVAALFVRGAPFLLRATLSLLLIARPMTDVPIAAITITLAALTIALSAASSRPLPEVSPSVPR